MNAGDTFKWSFSSHLWVVVSDPERNGDEVLIVNLTECRPWQDRSCVLDVGDHPFITKRTCVFYAKAQVFRNAELDAKLSSGQIVLREPIDQAILARIRAGAAISDRIAFKFRQLLGDQGLLT